MADPAYAHRQEYRRAFTLLHWKPELSHALCRGCSFPVLCPICQAKSEPKCIPCSRREATLAAAQVYTSTQTLLRYVSALLPCTLTGCKIVSHNYGQAHDAHAAELSGQSTASSLAQQDFALTAVLISWHSHNRHTLDAELSLTTSATTPCRQSWLNRQILTCRILQPC